MSENIIENHDLRGIELVNVQTTVEETTTDIQADTTEGGNLENIIIEGDRIKTDLLEFIDITDGSRESIELYNQLKQESEKISCNKSHGLGNVSDYINILKKYEEFSDKYGDKNLSLELDITNLKETADEFYEFSKLFNTITTKYKNIQTVDDEIVLRSILEQYKKINTFLDAIGNFKTQILGTSVLQVPSTIIKTKEQFSSVLKELQCISGYVANFTGSKRFRDDDHIKNAELSEKDKQALIRTEHALNSWMEMIENGASTKMLGQEVIKDFKELFGELVDVRDSIRDSRKTLENIIKPYRRGNY